MTSVPGLRIRGAMRPGYDTILTPGCLSFLAQLHRQFNPVRKELLAKRVTRQRELDAGKFPKFLVETAEIRRDTSWRGPTIPADLLDRRVEITGPVDRKMIINALNSEANCYMADFEDSTCPTWKNLVDGQINLRDAIAKRIDFTAPNGKQYKLKTDKAQKTTLLIRPRGWHLEEAHITIDGQPMSGSLFDFGVYFYTNHKALRAAGSGAYFYLPKLESHVEARLWNSVFVASQQALKVPVGSIRCTVLIETILASFEMEEIIYELRQHSAGLNW